MFSQGDAEIDFSVYSVDVFYDSLCHLEEEQDQVHRRVRGCARATDVVELVDLRKVGVSREAQEAGLLNFREVRSVQSDLDNYYTTTSKCRLCVLRTHARAFVHFLSPAETWVLPTVDVILLVKDEMIRLTSENDLLFDVENSESKEFSVDVTCTISEYIFC